MWAARLLAMEWWLVVGMVVGGGWWVEWWLVLVGGCACHLARAPAQQHSRTPWLHPRSRGVGPNVPLALAIGRWVPQPHVP
jgi:hypothetical protein